MPHPPQPGNAPPFQGIETLSLALAGSTKALEMRPRFRGLRLGPCGEELDRAPPGNAPPFQGIETGFQSATLQTFAPGNAPPFQGIETHRSHSGPDGRYLEMRPRFRGLRLYACTAWRWIPPILEMRPRFRGLRPRQFCSTPRGAGPGNAPPFQGIETRTYSTPLRVRVAWKCAPVSGD